MNNIIIDVYGDGSLVVEGKVGDRSLIQIPDKFQDHALDGKGIMPWIADMNSLGLNVVEGTAYGVIFQITELAVTKKE